MNGAAKRHRRQLVGAAVAGCGLVALTSCGWHPVYYSGQRSPTVVDKLALVDVALMPERAGQVLRQDLQQRLQRNAPEQGADYQLQVQYGIEQIGIAITPLTATTRIRFIATSHFELRSLGSHPGACLSGSTRLVDGLDTEDQQFFAQDLESETVLARLAQATADAIVARLAEGFAKPKGLACETG